MNRLTRLMLFRQQQTGLGLVIPTSNLEANHIWNQSVAWSDDQTTVATLNDPIHTIQDLTGNGYHIAQPIESSRMTLTDSGFFFDGNNDYGQANGLASLASDKANFTIYFVFTPVMDTSATRYTYMSLGNSGGTSPYFWFHDNTSSNQMVYILSDTAQVGSDSWSSTVRNDLQINVLTSDGTDVTLHVNDTEQVSATYPTGDFGFDLYTLGALGRSSISFHMEMTLLSHQFYSVAHDNSTRASIVSTLASHWGIS